MKVSKRQQRLVAKLARQTLSLDFQQLTPEELKNAPKGITRGYRNKFYHVHVYDNEWTTKGPAILAMIQTYSNKRIENHWSELFKIKNTLFGSETVAVEYYPALSKLIDQRNMYWLWIYPPGVLPIPVL